MEVAPPPKKDWLLRTVNYKLSYDFGDSLLLICIKDSFTPWKFTECLLQNAEDLFLRSQDLQRCNIAWLVIFGCNDPSFVSEFPLISKVDILPFSIGHPSTQSVENCRPCTKVPLLDQWWVKIDILMASGNLPDLNTRRSSVAISGNLPRTHLISSTAGRGHYTWRLELVNHLVYIALVGPGNYYSKNVNSDENA